MCNYNRRACIHTYLFQATIIITIVNCQLSLFTAICPLQDLQTDAAEACGLGKCKRSIDTPVIRHKRQDAVNFTTVTVNQSIVNDIAAVLSTVMNVSVNSGT